MKEELLEILKEIDNCLTLIEMGVRLGKIDIAKEMITELTDTIDLLNERIGEVECAKEK